MKWTSGGAERQDEHWLGTAEELDAITPAHDALLNKTALKMTAALEIGPVADQLEKVGRKRVERGHGAEPAVHAGGERQPCEWGHLGADVASRVIQAQLRMLCMQNCEWNIVSDV